jgi:hypothetical protein
MRSSSFIGIAEEVIPATFKKTDKVYEEQTDDAPQRSRGRGRGVGRGRGSGVITIHYMVRDVDSDVVNVMTMLVRNPPKKANLRSNSKNERSIQIDTLNTLVNYIVHYTHSFKDLLLVSFQLPQETIVHTYYFPSFFNKKFCFLQGPFVLSHQVHHNQCC